jgi:hypothetical protein
MSLITLASLAPAPAPQGITIAPVVLVAWPLVALAAFFRLSAGRALIAAYLTGWLFLPHAGINTPFVSYDKTVATSLGALLAVLFSHPQPLVKLRPKWFDLPILLFSILAPAGAILTNNLTPYDAAAFAAGQFVTWGVPYLLGRAYLTGWSDARDLAMGLFIGGLVYGPLCLAEVRLSPFLHYAVYHIWQHSVVQNLRDGGWRPMVFLQHGLAVGTFMASACLCGVWLWWSGCIRQVARLPVAIPMLCLWGTTLLVKSTGSLVLLLVGTAALLATRWIKVRAFVIALWLIPPIYVGARTLGGWTADAVVEQARHFFEPDRVQSLQFRIDHENLYVDRARAKPLFGRGYNFMIFEWEHPVVVDSLWIITLAMTGGVGLVSLLALFAVPTALVLWRVPPRLYAHPAFAGAIALMMVVLLYGLDNLANAMYNPAFALGLGALASVSRAPMIAPVPPPNRSPLFGRRPEQPKQTVRVAPPAGEIDPAFLAPGTLSLEEKL